MKTTDVETAIVGSGIAASIVAKELVLRDRGDILLLEAGGSTLMRDKRTWLDVITARRDPFENHRPTTSDATHHGNAHFRVPRSQLRVRGGTTLAWHGIAMRLMPEDFELKRRTGKGADWPIGYDELEPFYSLGEKTLQVSGNSADAGHPPRTSPFPLPPIPFELDDERFIGAMQGAGRSVQHQCIARNTAPLPGRTQCQSTGTCRYCPYGARLTGDQLVDDLGHEKRIEIRLRTVVSRILVSGAGRAVGLETIDQATGAVSKVRAERIIVCGGGLESAKLLIRSTSRDWPRGIGNTRDLVGRFFFTHPIIVLEGRWRDNPKRTTKELGYPTVTSRHFDSEGEQAAGKFSIQCWGSGHDLAEMMAGGHKRGAIERKVAGENSTGLAMLLDEVPQFESRVEPLAGLDRFGLERTKINYSWDVSLRDQISRMKEIVGGIITTMGGESKVVVERPAAHPMGTTRMSDSAGDGVVDKNLRVHGIENLYVCSSSVFPTGGAVNPTLTIAALAHRLGRHLA